jgi:hypothetical protein
MDKAWVYVTGDRQFSDDDIYGKVGAHSGKWMMMGVKSDVIDAYFVECAKAVEAGEFGRRQGTRGRRRQGRRCSDMLHQRFQG